MRRRRTQATRNRLCQQQHVTRLPACGAAWAHRGILGGGSPPRWRCIEVPSGGLPNEGGDATGCSGSDFRAVPAVPLSPMLPLRQPPRTIGCLGLKPGPSISCFRSVSRWSHGSLFVLVGLLSRSRFPPLSVLPGCACAPPTPAACPGRNTTHASSSSSQAAWQGRERGGWCARLLSGARPRIG